jgi:hypothetical protein
VNRQGESDAMTSTPSPSRNLPTSTLLLTGAALTVVGGIIGLAGATVTVLTAATVARRRIEQMDVPPTELARQQWRRARTAVSAGAGAWRNGDAAAIP